MSGFVIIMRKYRHIKNLLDVLLMVEEDDATKCFIARSERLISFCDQISLRLCENEMDSLSGHEF